MEKLLEKLKEYLHMDTEIPFEEFSDYYHKVIGELTQQFDELDQEARVQAMYVYSIVQSNADVRAKTNKVNAKAFKKMSAKCAFWVDAIKFNLGKAGMTPQEIEQATEEINNNI